MDIKIREARTTDAEAIAEIGKVAWLATYVDPRTGVTSRDVLSRNFDTPERIGKLKERLKADNEEHGPGGRTWVAELEGHVVGFVTALRLNGPHLKAIYRYPCYAGQGIGHTLMRTALEWLGPGEVYANVAVWNAATLAFFKEFGFVETGEKKEVAFPSGRSMPVSVMKRPAQ